MAADVEFIKSEKEKWKVLYDGFTYHSENRSSRIDESVRFYVCDVKRQLRCNARLHVRDNEHATLVGAHTHGPNIAKQEALRCVEQIRNAARNGVDYPTRIISAYLGGISEAAHAYMPNKCSLKRIIRKIREGNRILDIPRDMGFVIPPFVTALQNGTNMLFWDSNNPQNRAQNRMVILTTNENLEVLSRNRCWMSDGTFDSAPPGFRQVYVIGAIMEADGRFVACVYALMQFKDQNSYRMIFQQLKARSPFPLNPRKIMTDFESGIFAAYTMEFAQIDPTGCLFHLGQNTYKETRENHLAVLYKNDPQLNRCVRMLPALSFLPPNDVIQAFVSVFQPGSIYFDARAAPVIDYFERNYIGLVVGGVRGAPAVAPIQYWNVHYRVLHDMDRTNNKLEGFFNGFANFQLNARGRPNVWELIDAIKRENVSTSALLAQIRVGQAPSPRKPIYVRVDRRVKTLVQRYNAGAILPGELVAGCSVLLNI